MHQSYRWQVGLHQSLLPLQIDEKNIINFIEKITNHFSVHYLFFSNRRLSTPENLLIALK